jgi:uncharacterized lipoprotein YajG
VANLANPVANQFRPLVRGAAVVVVGLKRAWSPRSLDLDRTREHWSADWASQPKRHHRTGGQNRLSILDAKLLCTVYFVLSISMIKNALSLMAVVVLATGCALTNSSLPITLAPTVNQPLGSATGSLKVEEVKDERTVSDKAVVVQKVNSYGQRMRGAYVAQKPVGDIFRDALTSALEQNKFPLNPNGTMSLNTTIEDVDFQVLTGFWTATVEPKFRVKFSLIDQTSNKVLWKEMYTGKVQRKTAWGTASFVGEIVSAAAEDAIRQLVEDKTFRALFENPAK